MRAMVSALIMSFTFTAHASDMTARAKAAVTGLLKDPTGARFESLEQKPGAICGWINARNAYGGYAGRAPFVYVAAENRAYILEMTGNYAEGKAAIAAHREHCP